MHKNTTVPDFKQIKNDNKKPYWDVISQKMAHNVKLNMGSLYHMPTSGRIFSSAYCSTLQIISRLIK